MERGVEDLLRLAARSRRASAGEVHPLLAIAESGDPVFACAKKLARAQAELDRLRSDVAQFDAGFREHDAYSVSRHIDPDTGQEVHRFHVLIPIPKVDWAIRVGVIVHLCRSSLDNLVELLTETHSGQCFVDTEFPIFDNAAGFRRLDRRGARRGLPAKGSGLYKIRGVDPAAAKRIEELQPYNASESLPESILWVLHRLSNIDKHRAPAVVGLVGAVTGMQFAPRSAREVITSIGHVPFDEGTEFARFDPPPAGTPNVKADAKFSLDISFEGGPAGRRDVISTLGETVNEVAAILTEFLPFLARDGSGHGAS